MDFVQKSFTQLVELFRSLTPAARITTGLLLAAVAVGLALLFRAPFAGTGEYLFGGREFSQHELAQMEAAFAQAGLGDSQIEGNRLRVPAGQKAAYLAALADGGALPLDFDSIIDEALQGGGLFDSRELREQQLHHAKEKHLAMVISRMRGIEAATVRYEAEPRRGFGPREEPRAYVAVQPAGGAELDPEQVRAIRNTVAAGVSGLKRENVTVTDLVANRAYSGSDAGPHGTEGAYLAHKAEYERLWREKLSAQLRMIPGVMIAVNVELNPETARQEQTLKVDPKQVALATRETTETSTSREPAVAGRPGAAPNGLSNTAAAVSAAGGESTSETTRSESEQEAVASYDQIHVTRAGLAPQHVSASIGVPSSYFLSVWRQQNPPAAGAESREPTEAELKKTEEETRKWIEDSVVRLLPPRLNGDDPFPQVVVHSYQELPTAAIPEPAVADEALSWLAGNWSTLGLLLLGAVSLLFLRGMVRGRPSPGGAAAEALGEDRPPVTAAAAAAGPRLAATEGEPEAPRAKRKFRGTGSGSLREELTEIVKDDPDGAVNVLRGWIGDAA